MKTIAANLKSAIADDGTVATCVRILRKDGVVKGFTNHDISLTVNSVTYVPLPALERIVMKLRNNAEVSNQEFVGAFVLDLEEDDLANGVYNESAFDVLYVNWRDPSMGSVTIFAGNMGNIQWSQDGFRCDIYNLMHQIDGSIGNTITSKCRHNLFSQIGDTADQVGSCKVNEAANTFTGTVSSVTIQNLTFNTSGVGAAVDHLANGILTWTSGLNNGGRSEVKASTTSSIDLFLPSTYIISPGDAFTVTAGCDKTSTTCQNKFTNIINFGGFPFKGDQ